MVKEEKFSTDISTDKEVDIMPTVDYVKGMEDYLQKLKLMSYSEALRESKRNLKDSHIIQEDGEFTERYPYSRRSVGQRE